MTAGDRALTEELGELSGELRRRALRLFGRSLHIRTVDTGSCAVCESEIRLLSAPTTTCTVSGSSSPPHRAMRTC